MSCQCRVLQLCVCERLHPRRADLQTCTPGEQTAVSSESKYNLAECGTCGSHPAIGFYVDTSFDTRYSTLRYY